MIDLPNVTVTQDGSELVITHKSTKTETRISVQQADRWFLKFLRAIFNA